MSLKNSSDVMTETAITATETFIMTLGLDGASFDRLNGWRGRYFPPERNFIPAHLTFFHTLNGEQISRLKNAWVTTSPHGPIELQFVSPRFMGNGVAIDVNSIHLDALRDQCIDVMGGALTRQDRAPFHAHVTIQNKVKSDEAMVMYESFASSFQSWRGYGIALLIWKYLGGPWALEAEQRFERGRRRG